MIIHLGRGFKLSIESPKSENLALFKHGERAYDHIILFPATTKGQIAENSPFWRIS